MAIPNWLQISQRSGSGNKTITITAATLTQLTDRLADITVRTTDSSVTRTLSVRQSAPAPNFTVTPSAIHFPYEGKSIAITVVSDLPWTWTAFPDWVGVQSGYETGGPAGTSIFSLTALRNTTGAQLTGTFNLTAGNVTRSISCVQDAQNTPVDYYISFNQSSVSFDAEGGTITIPFDTNIQNLSAVDVMIDGSWVSARFSGNTLIVDCESFEGTEPRTGEITFNYRNVEVGSLPVYQSSPVPQNIISYTYKYKGETWYSSASTAIFNTAYILDADGNPLNLVSNTLTPAGYGVAVFDGEPATINQGFIQPNSRRTELETITLPKSVRVIGDSTFVGIDDSHLKKVTGLKNVISLGYRAFYNLYTLEEIEWPDRLDYWGDESFYGTGIKKAVIPDTEVIPYKAFEHSYVEEVEFKGNSLRTISNKAFYLSSLQYIVIPEGVTTINTDAFRVNNMVMASLPSTITSMSSGAVKADGVIYVNATTPPSASTYPLTYSSCPVVVPCESIDDYKTARGWSEYRDQYVCSFAGLFTFKETTKEVIKAAGSIEVGYFTDTPLSELSIVSSQSWASARFGNGKLYISFGENGQASSRSATFTVYRGTDLISTNTFTLTQNTVAPVLSFNTSAYTFEDSGGSVSIGFTTNIDDLVEISFTVSDSWITVSPNGNSITVSCVHNQGFERNTTITASYGSNILDTIEINQGSEPYIVFDPDYMTIDWYHTGEEIEVQYTTNIPHTWQRHFVSTNEHIRVNYDMDTGKLFLDFDTNISSSIIETSIRGYYMVSTLCSNVLTVVQDRFVDNITLQPNQIMYITESGEKARCMVYPGRNPSYEIPADMKIGVDSEGDTILNKAVSNVVTDGVGIITYQFPITIAGDILWNYHFHGYTDGSGNMERGYNEDIIYAKLPDSVEYLGLAFYKCKNIKTYIYPEGVKYPTGASRDGDFSPFEDFSWEEIPLIFYDDGNLPRGYFKGCTNLQEVVLPDHLTSLSYNTFERCESLSAVTLPANLQGRLPEFRDTKVTTIVIPEGVDRFYSFGGMTTLESVTLPSGITTLPDGAFGSCPNLIEINVPTDFYKNLTHIGAGAFNGCRAVLEGTDLVLSTDLNGEIGYGAFNGCYLNSVTFVSGEEVYPYVDSLGEFAFGDNNLESYPIYVPFAHVDTYKEEWSYYASRIYEDTPHNTKASLFFPSGCTIDLQYVPNENTSITIDSFRVPGRYQNWAIVGSHRGYNTIEMGCYYTPPYSNVLRCNFGGLRNYDAVLDLRIEHLDTYLDYNGCIIDGVEHTFTGTSYEFESSLFVGGLASDVQTGGTKTIGTITIKESGVVVRKYVPQSNGTYYEEIEGRSYTATGGTPTYYPAE